MFPDLLNFGGIVIKTYGLFVAVGFLVAMSYLRGQAAERGVSPVFITNLCFYVLISGLIGSRLFYVVLNWEFYRNNPADVFFIWSGGLVLYGGVIFAAAVGVFYIIKNKLPLPGILDIAAPALFLGVAIGRVGCLSAGCCYGMRTHGAWGVVFSHPMALAPLGIKLHPTQLYESLFCFILFLAGHYFNKWRNMKRPPGNIFRRIFQTSGDDGSRVGNGVSTGDGAPAGLTFFTSLILYSVWRFFIEFVRWDDRGTKILAMYPSQFIAIVIIAFSAGFILYMSLRGTKSRSNLLVL